jgi:SAM-dependent methyltransferase
MNSRLRRSKVAAPANWYTTFFSGAVLKSLGGMYPPEYTRLQADFLVKSLRLEEKARVLDAPCGEGRLALDLAARGYRLHGVDLTPQYIDTARARAKERGLAAEFHVADMRELPGGASFDGAFCFGNSFGYLDDAGNFEFLKAVAASLRPGARFVLDYPLVLEAISCVFIENSWHELEDLLCLRTGSYDPARGRAEVRYTFIDGAAREAKEASYRVYSYRELAELCGDAGFGNFEGLGSLDGEPFKLGSKGLLAIATRK